jgi:hypothetical protein
MAMSQQAGAANIPAAMGGDASINPQALDAASQSALQAAQPAQGYASNSDPAMQAVQSVRSNPLNQLTGVLAGGGMGAATTNPGGSSAGNFLQGFTAGLQAPAKVYALKQAELQSTIDATPLSATYPSIADRYPAFSGMPTKIALDHIQQISKDAVDLYTKNQEINAAAQAQEVNQVNAGSYRNSVALALGSDASGINLSKPNNLLDSAVDTNGNPFPDDVGAHVGTNGIVVDKDNQPIQGAHIVQGGKLIGMKDNDVSDFVRWNIMQKQQGNDQQQMTLNQQENAWNMLFRETNQYVAMRGSALGLVGQLNMRSDRALALVSQGQITPQELQAVNEDIAAIMKGGVPAEAEVKGISYGSLKADLEKKIGYLMNNPAAVTLPDIQAKLKDDLTRIKDIDQKLVLANLNQAAIAHGTLINSSTENKQRWHEYANNITQDVLGGNFTIPDAKGNPTFDTQRFTAAYGSQGIGGPANVWGGPAGSNQMLTPLSNGPAEGTQATKVINGKPTLLTFTKGRWVY